MYKFYKITLLTLFFSLPVTTVFFTTSCSKQDYSLYYRSLKHYKGKDIGLDISLFKVDFSSFVKTDTNLKTRLDTLNNLTTIANPVDYVGYRTFSFVGKTASGFSMGTGWIISHNISNADDNYQYWTMSNQHVTNDWLKDSNTYQDVYWSTSYSYGLDEPLLDYPSDYLRFPTDSVEIAPEKVDSIATTFSNDLITPFYNGMHTASTAVVCAGYPNKTHTTHNYFQQWNYEDQSSVYSYYTMYGTYIKNADLYIYENSYMFTPGSFANLTSGASGSMVIDKNTHQVLGVYWGTIEEGAVTYPSAVILNTNGHQPYLGIWHNYNKLDVISTIVGTKIYN